MDPVCANCGEPLDHPKDYFCCWTCEKEFYRDMAEFNHTAYDKSGPPDAPALDPPPWAFQ